MTLRRFSSLREPLDHAFLRDRLKSAKSYKRIAGLFPQLHLRAGRGGDRRDPQGADRLQQ
jgi:hypothetical protein